MDRLFMDDSHRDDCLILVENKGFMLVEELERTCSLSTSNRLTTRQSSNKFGSVLAARRFNTLPTTLNSSSINNLFVLSSSRQKISFSRLLDKRLVLSSPGE